MSTNDNRSKCEVGAAFMLPGNQQEQCDDPEMFLYQSNTIRIYVNIENRKIHMTGSGSRERFIELCNLFLCVDVFCSSDMRKYGAFGKYKEVRVDFTFKGMLQRVGINTSA